MDVEAPQLALAAPWRRCANQQLAELRCAELEPLEDSGLSTAAEKNGLLGAQSEAHKDQATCCDMRARARDLDPETPES